MKQFPEDSNRYRPSSDIPIGYSYTTRNTKPRPLNLSNPSRGSQIYEDQNRQIEIVSTFFYDLETQLFERIYEQTRNEEVGQRININKSYTTGIQTAEIQDPEKSRKQGDHKYQSTIESRKTVNEMEMKMKFILTENDKLVEIQRSLNK